MLSSYVKWKYVDSICMTCPASLPCLTRGQVDYFQRPDHTLVILFDVIGKFVAVADRRVTQAIRIKAPAECPALDAKLRWLYKRLGDEEKRGKLTMAYEGIVDELAAIGESVDE